MSRSRNTPERGEPLTKKALQNMSKEDLIKMVLDLQREQQKGSAASKVASERDKEMREVYDLLNFSGPFGGTRSDLLETYYDETGTQF